jgi:ribose 5-phosphate isomerase B
VLALGGRALGETFALAIVDEFLTTSFEGGRHERRIAQISDIERTECEG